MDQQWRSLYGQCKMKLITGDDRNDTEVALAAFADKCHNCQVGHKVADCPHKRNMGKGNKNKCKQCSHCEKMGHIEANCWNRPVTPASIRNGTNHHVSMATNKAMQQLMMVTMIPLVNCFVWPSRRKIAFPSVTKLLKDPCVWIGDTGATKHITPHIQGMQNMKQDKSGTGITMGNDAVVKGTHTGDLPWYSL